MQALGFRLRDLGFRNIASGSAKEPARRDSPFGALRSSLDEGRLRSRRDR